MNEVVMCRGRCDGGRKTGEPGQARQFLLLLRQIALPLSFLLPRHVVRRITRENVRPEERAGDLVGGERTRPRKPPNSEIRRPLTLETPTRSVNAALEKSGMSCLSLFPRHLRLRFACRLATAGARLEARRGSLRLSRRALGSPTIGRFIPALSVTPPPPNHKAALR